MSRARIMGKKFLFFIILVMISNRAVAGLEFGTRGSFRRPLKILCVLGSFPLLPEIYVVNQLAGLLERGHDVYIYANRQGQRIVHPIVAQYNLVGRTYYKKLPRDIHTYDIIICQFGPLGKNFVKIKKQLGLKAKIVTCFRGYDISREIKSKGKHTYDTLFEEGDYFLPVCKYFKNILIELGCPPHKIRVHHSAIDLQKFALRQDIRNYNSEKITIVSVNRLVPKKGTVYAILAVASLLKKYPQIEYLVMGGGPLEDQLMQIIRKHGAADNIKLLGWGNHDDVLRLLHAADIFVLPSVTDSSGNEEGIPNALKEAMSVGIPVVSTYHAGIGELVKNGKTGFLVRCASVSELAKKIEYLINNTEEARFMGFAAHDHVQEEYDTEKLNDKLVEIFYSLLD